MKKSKPTRILEMARPIKCDMCDGCYESVIFDKNTGEPVGPSYSGVCIYDIGPSMYEGALMEYYQRKT